MEKIKQHYAWPSEKPHVLPNEHGWFHNPEKVKALESLIKPNMNILCEIGSWLGQSTRVLLNAQPTAYVLSIDHWEGSSEHNITQFPFLPVLYETFLVNCWEYRDRLIPIKANSIDGLQIIAKYNIKPDLILIDASHKYQDVLKDLETAYQLFPNAIICGDDYSWMEPQYRCFNPAKKPTDLKYYPIRRAVAKFCKKYSNKTLYLPQNQEQLWCIK